MLPLGFWSTKKPGWNLVNEAETVFSERGGVSTFFGTCQRAVSITLCTWCAMTCQRAVSITLCTLVCYAHYSARGRCPLRFVRWCAMHTVVPEGGVHYTLYVGVLCRARERCPLRFVLGVLCTL